MVKNIIENLIETLWDKLGVIYDVVVTKIIYSDNDTGDEIIATNKNGLIDFYMPDFSFKNCVIEVTNLVSGWLMSIFFDRENNDVHTGKILNVFFERA